MSKWRGHRRKNMSERAGWLGAHCDEFARIASIYRRAVTE